MDVNNAYMQLLNKWLQPMGPNEAMKMRGAQIGPAEAMKMVPNTSGAQVGPMELQKMIQAGQIGPEEIMKLFELLGPAERMRFIQNSGPRPGLISPSIIPSVGSFVRG